MTKNQSYMNKLSFPPKVIIPFDNQYEQRAMSPDVVQYLRWCVVGAPETLPLVQ